MKKIILVLTALASVWGVGSWELGAKSKEQRASSHEGSGATSEHKIVTLSDVQWADAPPSLPPGVKMAVLDGDPNKSGSFTVWLKTPAGYKIPPHTHPTTERVTGISGTARLGMGEKFDENIAKDVGPGTFVVLPANMAHFAYSAQESVLQVQSEGPFQIKYINPSEDPRGEKK